MESNRLRAKLRDYYEAEGRRDAVRLRLPLNTYVPVFEAAPLHCRAAVFRTSAPRWKRITSAMASPSGSPTNWGRSGKLQVAARGSAQRFKAGGNVRRIGRQLHVDLVLEGGVSFEGNRIGVATNV